MWFHLTKLRLYLPNADTVGEKLHGEEFAELVAEYGGLESYVLECADQPSEFTLLSVWDQEDEANAFFDSKVYADFIAEIEPALISPVCERSLEVMKTPEKA